LFGDVSGFFFYSCTVRPQFAFVSFQETMIFCSGSLPSARDFFSSVYLNPVPPRLILQILGQASRTHPIFFACFFPSCHDVWTFSPWQAITQSPVVLTLAGRFTSISIDMGSACLILLMTCLPVRLTLDLRTLFDRTQSVVFSLILRGQRLRWILVIVLFAFPPLKGAQPFSFFEMSFFPRSPFLGFFIGQNVPSAVRSLSALFPFRA